MKKAALVEVLGSQQAIAELLEISKGAVSQWPPIVPELRQYQIREKIPDIDRRLAAAARRRAAA